jgi:transcriptional regulator with XRE-family HTH domain
MRVAVPDADQIRSSIARDTIGCAADLAAELRRHILVEELRTGRSLGRARLAETLGVSASSVYAYLGGRTLPPSDLFGRLLDALTVPAHDRERLSIARDNLDLRSKLRHLASPSGELPPDPPGFVGRTEELARLDQFLAIDAPEPPQVMISIVSGMAGVGKTVLALRWAHRVRDRFPDGQLYLDLRGWHADPVPADEALVTLLGNLGVRRDDLVQAHAAARCRTLLADRRMLVVLDNVRSTNQIRDLLPGTPSCRVLVTSRDRLAGLVARHGARRIELGIPPTSWALARSAGTVQSILA